MFLFVQSEHTSSELQDLPDVVLHCIITKLPIQGRCNLAAAHRSFNEFLSQNVFWRDLIMDNDKAFVNAVCHYVFDHSESVTSILIDNLSSPESTFVSLWTDVLLSAFKNVCKVHVARSTFLTSGMFVAHTPLLSELHLQSCPNLSAFTLIQGFLCALPRNLKVLDVTGVAGLNEQSAITLATTCEALEKLDMSGYWGAWLCVNCVKKIVTGCPQLAWFDLCPYIAQSPSWVQLLLEQGGVNNRVITFGPYVQRLVAANQDLD